MFEPPVNKIFPVHNSKSYSLGALTTMRRSWLSAIGWAGRGCSKHWLWLSPVARPASSLHVIKCLLQPLSSLWRSSMSYVIYALTHLQLSLQALQKGPCPQAVAQPTESGIELPIRPCLLWLEVITTRGGMIERHRLDRSCTRHPILTTTPIKPMALKLQPRHSPLDSSATFVIIPT